jgi:RNA polymerase sigma-70 factor (ECF subfamily)
LTEPEAIRRAQEGDAAGFTALYEVHSKRVYNLCLRIVKNPPDAEDLTQQVFLQVFRKIGTFRGDSGFSTWLHRVAVNLALMHLRRKKPIEMNPIAASPDQGNEDPAEFCGRDNSMLLAIERLHLWRAIRQLPAGYKRLFLLHDLMGYQHSEIAELVGCSIGCSKSQVHRARRRLRRLLQMEAPERRAALA